MFRLGDLCMYFTEQIRRDKAKIGQPIRLKKATCFLLALLLLLSLNAALQSQSVLASSSSPTWWNGHYRCRQQLKLCTFNSAIAAGSDVRTSVDTAALEDAGKVRADRMDWRILFYDTSNSTWIEIARDYTDSSATWFRTRGDIAPNSSESDYYAYYGYPAESTPPYAYTHSGGASSIYTVLDSSQGEAVRGYYNGYQAWEYRIGTSTTADSGLSFAKDESNPILAHTLPWEGSHVHGPFVVYYNGLYMMYYDGDWGGTPEIGLATSTDGSNFTKYGNGPVVPLGPGWETDNVSFPFVFVDNSEVDSNKRFKMLYAGSVNGGGWPGSAIGYAYSADGFTWTKYSGNPILQGDAGQWDSQGVIPGSVVKTGNTYRLFFVGNDGSYIQTGLATASSFEGPYVKYTTNPVVRKRSSATQDLTSDLNAGADTVVVLDSSVFSINEPVWLYSDSGNAQLTRVQSIDSPTQLTIADDASSSYTTAQGAYIRSWLCGSNNITTVYYDGSNWKAWMTAFMALPTLLLETTAYATSTDGISWTLDYAHSPPLVLGGSREWDLASAENLRIMNTTPRTPTNFSGTADSATVVTWSWTDASSLEDGYTVNDEKGVQKGRVGANTASWQETGLSPNTLYIRHAESIVSTSYNPVLPESRTSHPSNECHLCTLAARPGVPAVGSPTRATLDVAIDPASNPPATEYAIRETATAKYVQPDGTLGNSLAWRTLADWGGSSGLTVTGLSAGYTYTFKVIARNADNVETAFSPDASASTYGNVFYFAEGTCRPGFDSYICVMNPGSPDAKVKVTYMKGDGATAVDNFTVPGNSRYTLRVNDKLGTADDAAHDFSCKVETTNKAGIVVERPMHFDYRGWTGGSDAMGAR
jgi:predicted GH43/DUF377 family glycosyl hydrolase